MEYEKIESELIFILSLMEKWQKAGAVALIEQNIALDGLQNVYKQIIQLPSNAVVSTVECDCQTPQPTPDEESIIEELEQIIEEQEDVIEEQEEVIEEQKEIIEEQKEIIVEQELVVEEQEAVIEEQQEVIEEQEQEIEEATAIEPEKPQIAPEILLFGQVITERQKKNYIFELFWRDEHYYDQEVAKLEAMPDLDTALIYISEKYNWSAQCPFAESFITLLSNKF